VLRYLVNSLKPLHGKIESNANMMKIICALKLIYVYALDSNLNLFFIMEVFNIYVHLDILFKMMDQEILIMFICLNKLIGAI